MNRLNRLLLAVGVLLVAAAAVQASVTVNMTYTGRQCGGRFLQIRTRSPGGRHPCGHELAVPEKRVRDLQMNNHSYELIFRVYNDRLRQYAIRGGWQSGWVPRTDHRGHDRV